MRKPPKKSYDPPPRLGIYEFTYILNGQQKKSRYDNASSEQSITRCLKSIGATNIRCNYL